VADDGCDLLCLDLPLAEGIRHSLIDRRAAAPAAARAAALGDPTRLQLAFALAHGGELCVCDLAWISGRAQNLVSHHLRHLRQAGLAESRREHKMVLYSLTDPGRALLDSLLSASQEAVR
jgi:ArsR family transcriptional regulator, lead/cadmium/zinc/bismuth-responsive transcriptional repressor